MAFEMPRPGVGHGELARYVGVWEGEEILTPTPYDPHGGVARGRFEYHMVCGGFFLRCEYTQRRGAEVNFEGHGVYGWNPASGLYTMYWFDSMGGAGPDKPVMGSSEGDLIVYESRGGMGLARYVHGFEGEIQIFRLELSQDGLSWMCPLAGRYERVG